MNMQNTGSATRLIVATLLAIAVLVSVPQRSFAAERSWTGRITSDMCKAGMDHDCIMNCIKAGEKYVFVNKGQVHAIQKQDFADLATHAGHVVTLTGELGSDGKTITVTKVTMTPGPRK